MKLDQKISLFLAILAFITILINYRKSISNNKLKKENLMLDKILILLKLSENKNSSELIDILETGLFGLNSSKNSNAALNKSLIEKGGRKSSQIDNHEIIFADNTNRSSLFIKANILPNNQTHQHVKKLSEKPDLFIDGAMMIEHPREYKKFGKEEIKFVIDESKSPNLFKSFPEILNKKDLPFIQPPKNEGKYFISSIKKATQEEPMTFNLGGNLNYQKQKILEKFLRNKFNDKTDILSLYEHPINELDWKKDFSTMITIKVIVITSDNKFLFVRRPLKDTDYYPGSWIPGIDEQMLSKPLNNQEAFYNDNSIDPLKTPDMDFFSGGIRGLLEELAVTENLINDIGYLALYREVESYITNVLMISELKIDSEEVSRLIPFADNYFETKEFEFRENNHKLLSSLLLNDQYNPMNKKLGVGYWHPDSRLRLLIGCNHLYGEENTLGMLNQLIHFFN